MLLAPERGIISVLAVGASRKKEKIRIYNAKFLDWFSFYFLLYHAIIVDGPGKNRKIADGLPEFIVAWNGKAAFAAE